MKSYINIPKRAAIHFNSTIPDGQDIRITNNFFKLLVKGFINNSLNYYDKVKELPFVYKEKQIHTAICPAIRDITPAFLQECPAIRKKFIKRYKQEKTGWIDYWALYRKVSFFVEIKHSFFSLRTNKLNAASINKWAEAKDQLKSIKHLGKEWSSGEDGIFMPIYIIPYYKTSERCANVDEKSLTNSHNYIIDTLKRTAKVDFAALILLDKKYVGPHHYENTKELHPAISVISAIHHKYQSNS